MYCQSTPLKGDQTVLSPLRPSQDQAWSCRAASAGQGQGQSCGAGVLHASILGPNKALVPACKSLVSCNPLCCFLRVPIWYIYIICSHIFAIRATSHPLKVGKSGELYPEDPKFLHELHGELAEIEPPVYSEQGQQRGRKC